jgi:MinD-like ATPase involved in chromosome partitioning or flagellar assembly
MDLKNYRVVTLANTKFFRHYLEEYLPSKVVIPSEIIKLEEIREIACAYTDIKFILTSGSEDNRDFPNKPVSINEPGILFIRNINGLSDFKKVISTIDETGFPGKDTGATILESPEIDKELRFIKQQVIAVFSPQGGIGKTTIAANIASYFGKIRKVKTLLIDFNFMEGASDLSLRMKIPGYPNLGVFIENIQESLGAIEQSTLKVKELNINLILPPISLHQSDRFDIEMLNSLIYAARSIYNYIIIDLPCRFDNVFLETLNLSTVVLLITGQEASQVLKLKNYLKFLNLNQKRGLVINNVNEMPGLDVEDIKVISEIPLFSVIPLIKKNEIDFLKIGRNNTEILDMQVHLIDLINNIVLI